MASESGTMMGEPPLKTYPSIERVVKLGILPEENQDEEENWNIRVQY